MASKSDHQCDTCGRKFADKYGHTRHLSRATPCRARTFECETGCGRRFSTERGKEVHENKCRKVASDPEAAKSADSDLVTSQYIQPFEPPTFRITPEFLEEVATGMTECDRNACLRGDIDALARVMISLVQTVHFDKRLRNIRLDPRCLDQVIVYMPRTSGSCLEIGSELPCWELWPLTTAISSLFQRVSWSVAVTALSRDLQALARAVANVGRVPTLQAVVDASREEMKAYLFNLEAGVLPQRGILRCEFQALGEESALSIDAEALLIAVDSWLVALGGRVGRVEQDSFEGQETLSGLFEQYAKIAAKGAVEYLTQSFPLRKGSPPTCETASPTAFPCDLVDPDGLCESAAYRSLSGWWVAERSRVAKALGFRFVTLLAALVATCDIPELKMVPLLAGWLEVKANINWAADLAADDCLERMRLVAAEVYGGEAWYEKLRRTAVSDETRPREVRDVRNDSLSTIEAAQK